MTFPTPEEIARTLFESQRGRMNTTDGNRRVLVWRSSEVPQEFWDHYMADGEAVWRLFADKLHR
jgi:hypothetical protein